MATEKNPCLASLERVCATAGGTIAHIPALSTLPEFEITAVRHEPPGKTADETAQAFRNSPCFLPTLTKNAPAFRRGPRLDLRAGCPFSPSAGNGCFECRQASLLRMGRLGPPLSRLNRCVIWPSVKGVHHMVGLQARGAPRVQSRQGPGRRGLCWQGALLHDDHNDAQPGAPNSRVTGPIWQIARTAIL